MDKLTLTISGTPIQGGGAPVGGRGVLENIIQLGVTYLYIGAVILALFFLIWGGFSWITSEGDKQRLAQARLRIVFAILGLLVAFFAFFVISMISNFFGVDLLSVPVFGGGGGGARKP